MNSPGRLVSVRRNRAAVCEDFFDYFSNPRISRASVVGGSLACVPPNCIEPGNFRTGSSRATAP